jgi:carbamoylphosphate synthase large subunit
MHVIFVEPAFPRNQREFPRALAEVGAKVSGIGEAPAASLPDPIRQHLWQYEQVPSVVDEGSVYQAVRRIQTRSWVDRLEATVEAHIMPIAKVREACEIPGTTTRTAWLCRDKPSMKEALRQAGIPCAQSLGSQDRAEIHDFAQRVGYPLIVKPPAGAGASGATRVDSSEELDRALDQAGLRHGRTVAIEEYIEGHEGFYDTVTLDGKVVHEFITHYYPNVLEAMRTRWISPQFITTNRVDTAAAYDEVKRMGRRVIEVLGIDTSATHMEWFFGPKGLKFSEIGCRPPGVGAWDLYCAANEFDLYREWAHLIVHGAPSRTPSRRFSAGIINLRPDRDGTIAGYEGQALIESTLREFVIDTHLPPAGTPTQGVEAGYMANAWIRMRHPDYDTLRSLLDEVGRTVKVRAH